MKKIPIIAFSSTPKVEIKLSKLQRDFGKNRSQIIRDLIINASKTPASEHQTERYPAPITPLGQEGIIKNFFELLSGFPPKNLIVLSQALIVHNQKILIVNPPKKGQVIKGSTWEFPSSIVNTLNAQSELAAYLHKYFGNKVVIDQLITGRVVPDRTVSGNLVLSISFSCKIKGVNLISENKYPNTKWVPCSEVSRYFSHSVGDSIILWLSQFK